MSTCSLQRHRTMLDELRGAFSQAGCVYRAVGVEAIPEVLGAMRMLIEEGLLSEGLYAEYSGSLEFSPPAELGGARSLVIVATPSQPVKARFQTEMGELDATIPSTYLKSTALARCIDLLEGILRPAGYSVAAASVPVRLLAVRSGLAEYGRNNNAYVRELGSLCRFDAFVTDADLVPPDIPREGLSYFLVGGRHPELGRWSRPRRMGRCASCMACHHVCPTRCIPYPGEGVVIEAERCLTYLNEHEGEWPTWVSPGAHNCLIGCMRCQQMCPANRYFLRSEKLVVEFDREETAVILQNLPAAELPPALLDKLKRIDMDEYSTVLGRNLLALIDSARERDRSGRMFLATP